MGKSFKLYIAFIAVSMLLCLAGLSVSATEYPDTLRVGIYYGSGTVSSITFESADGFSVGLTSDRDFYCFDTVDNNSVTVSKTPSGTYHILYASFSTHDEMTASLREMRTQGTDVFPAYHNNSYCILSGTFSSADEAQTVVDTLGTEATVITPSSSSLSLKAAAGKVLFVFDSANGNITVHSRDTENPDSLISISGGAAGTYRGGFECKSLDGSTLTVVNTVPVEWYLYSVVCKEMSPSWHVEALKTQAVCARTFALRRINYHSSYGADVCRTVCCQAYSTTADQSENVHTAVDETYGQLLFYEDELVQAVYSSSMGSSTEDVKNVWGSSFPYLVSVENPYEDTENIYNGKWSHTLTTARATELMNSYGIGTVKDISAIEYSNAGRVIKLKVVGTNGEKIFEREKCRTVFGEATFSQKYTVTKGGVITYPTAFVTNGTETVQKTLDGVAILSGSNTVYKETQDYTAINGTKKVAYKATTNGGSPDTYTFTGEGWGHGVGMSQYGAKGMAEAGFDYEEILTHYYTGTHLEQAY